jgi:hypothetical protein
MTVDERLQPALPKSFRRPDLEATGFVGWRTWDAFRTSSSDVPDGPGVYVVLRESTRPPKFLTVNPGGHYKGDDPTVPVATLKDAWVPGAHVLNIGKANTLRSRLRTYARYGGGASKAAHRGGRYIWQLADSNQLLVAWHPISWGETAREYESRLLAHFKTLHAGRRPFANLVD